MVDLVSQYEKIKPEVETAINGVMNSAAYINGVLPFLEPPPLTIVSLDTPTSAPASIKASTKSNLPS